MAPEFSGPSTGAQAPQSGLVSLKSFPISFSPSTTRQEGLDHVIHDSGRPAPARWISPLSAWSTAPTDLQPI
jgi:hypothetical protein